MSSDVAVREVLDEWQQFVDATHEPSELDSLDAARIAGRILKCSREIQQVLDPTEPRAEYARTAENNTLAAERLSIEMLGAQLADNDVYVRSLSRQSFEALQAAGENLRLALDTDEPDTEPATYPPSADIDLTDSTSTETIELDEPLDLRDDSPILSAVKPGLEVDGSMRRAVSAPSTDAPSTTEALEDPEQLTGADDITIEDPVDDLVVEPISDLVVEPISEDPHVATESDEGTEPLAVAATPIGEAVAEPDEELEGATHALWDSEIEGDTVLERRRARSAQRKQLRVMRVDALRAERAVVRRNHMERLAAGHEVTVRSRSRLFFQVVNAILVGAIMVGVVIGGALLAAYVSRTWF